ncbi:MAG: hypothetical protein P0S93_00940 [Candidatus Neptunochlamydia sp.]|nr:hypothetical protein [Candidatus Neptunochlamydia sp.]
MKYVKINSFEKHLDEALPDHPSEVYFILMEDPFERRFVSERIAKKIGFEVTRLGKEQLLEELESLSLFSSKRTLICDEAAEKEIPKVEDLVLIFTGKSTPLFYKKMEKEGIILDLTHEKPWDRKNRLQRWLLEYARDCGKALSVDGATYLIDFSHADFAMLLQELDKVIAYSGEEKKLSLERIKEISSLDPVQSGWQLSETVVLGGTVHFGDTDPYALIGQLRYQLQFGLQITLAKEPRKASLKKIEKFQRSGLKSPYFVEGLKELFDLEMKIRSNISNQGLLFDQFRAKLAAKR